jgi:hypothetical protein
MRRQASTWVCSTLVSVEGQTGWRGVYCDRTGRNRGASWRHLKPIKLELEMKLLKI